MAEGYPGARRQEEEKGERGGGEVLLGGGFVRRRGVQVSKSSEAERPNWKAGRRRAGGAARWR